MSERTLRDWTEDFTHENGNYVCICWTCKHEFIGHKRRATCKVCATAQPAPDAVAEADDALDALIAERVREAYDRGVNYMASCMYHHFGSISEMERSAEHNDEVLAARTKALANFDGKLNMNLSQSEEYVAAIYAAAEEAARASKEGR